MMSAMTLSSLAKELDAELNGEASFDQVCTDTRQLQVGDLFVALKGEHFNASDFLVDAANQGAVAAVTEEKAELNIPSLRVKDARKALGLIARSNRRAFQGPLIAITGSAGKTSCKQMLASILSEAGAVLATEGNLNNEIGVPLTLLNISPQHQYAVIEMGASRQGDIEYLCQFAEPNIALVTNIMPAHIEGFGDLETVAKTKAEIYAGLANGGIAIINLDDTYLNQVSKQWQSKPEKVISFSLGNVKADVYASNIQQDAMDGLSFTLHAEGQYTDVKMSFLGKHNVANALAAAAAALSAGVQLNQIKQGLEKVAVVPGRLNRILCDGFTLIDDSYNANPGSVKAAIDVLAESAGDTTLVLGNMAELGDQAAVLHLEVGEYAKEKGIKQLLAVGEMSQNLIEGFAGKGLCFSSFTELLAHCEQQVFSGTVLVKGSRSAKMERLVNKFKMNTLAGESS
jgi:UDP-N-acetylmuramoyl-tripeptide--D-alanyl-D-alanine ligase